MTTPLDAAQMDTPLNFNQETYSNLVDKFRGMVDRTVGSPRSPLKQSQSVLSGRRNAKAFGGPKASYN